MPCPHTKPHSYSLKLALIVSIPKTFFFFICDEGFCFYLEHLTALIYLSITGTFWQYDILVDIQFQLYWSNSNIRQQSATVDSNSGDLKGLVIIGTARKYQDSRGIIRCKLAWSQNYTTMNKETLREQDQGGYLLHDECDGRIIWVGHKDQVSSSCIMLTLFTPLPDCKCAHFRHPSSREQTNPFNNLPSLTGPRSACVSVKTPFIHQKRQTCWTTSWHVTPFLAT